jgi:membrane-associated protease RseP (regulator of RpoE activity)
MRKFPFLHLVLFLLTLFSTLVVGALQTGADVLKQPLQIYKGIPFSITLLLILLTHELSHYFTSRRHGVEATLPYFIPAPTIIGTFGAFIKMKSPIITRKALIDIGASGPIAGFFISVIAVFIGLSISDYVPASEVKEGINLGDSLLFLAISRIVFGPLPVDAQIVLNPVAFAGWIGLFVTSINLIPVGQLDGGHIAYAFLGKRHARLSVLLVGVLAVLGILLWEGWLVWAVLLLFLGLKHPPVLYWEMELDKSRKITGWSALLVFIVTFIPVPFQIL